MGGDEVTGGKIYCGSDWKKPQKGKENLSSQGRGGREGEKLGPLGLQGSHWLTRGKENHMVGD